MKKIGLALIFLFVFPLFSSLITIQPVQKAYATSPTLALHVDGNQIKDSDDNVVYLRGVNKNEVFLPNPGGKWLGVTGWNPTRASDELDQMKAWGINVVRVFEPLHDWISNRQDAYGNYHKDVVFAFASLCAQKGIYLIFAGFSVVDEYEQGYQQDYLPYPPFIQSGLPTTLIPNSATWVNLWIDIANTLKTIPSVILDPHNEPQYWYNGGSITDWTGPLQAVITGARNTGFTGLIIYQVDAGTAYNFDNGYTASLSWVDNYPMTDTTGNLVIGTHQYRGYNAIGYWNSGAKAITTEDITTALTHELIYHVLNDLHKPIFIGECGAFLGDADEQTAFTNQLALYNSLGISYTGFAWWDWAGLAMVTDLFNPGDTPTTSGLILKNALAESLPPAPITYTINILSGTGGYTSPVANTYYWQNSSGHSITAIPNSGYVFDHWSGLYSGTNNPYTLTVSSSGTLTPVFSLIPSSPPSESWASAIKITIDHTKIDSDLVNFPVLVYLNSSRIDWTKVQDDLDDLRFRTSDNSTLLSYEIDSYTVNDKAWIWVKILLVSHTVDTVFWMYYNNPTATSGEDALNVWDNNFVMVQHMKDATTSTILDSTSNNNDGTKVNANNPLETSNGKIDNAQSFDGSSAYIDLTNDYVFTNDNTFTFWANPASKSLNGIIEGKLGYYAYLYVQSVDGNLYRLYGETNTDGDSFTLTFNSVVPIGYLYHFAITEDSSKVWRLYLNGVLQTVTSTTTNSQLTMRRIGQGRDGTDFYLGVLDEVRASNVIRSSAWIKASYESEIDSLLTYGSSLPFSLSSTIIISAIGGGTVSPSGMYVWDLDSAHTLTATPSAGYTFYAWGGLGGGSTSNPFSLTVDSDGTVTAIFTTPNIVVNSPPIATSYLDTISLRSGINFKTPTTGSYFYVSTPITLRKAAINASHLLFMSSFSSRHVTDLTMWTTTLGARFYIDSWFTSKTSSATFDVNWLYSGPHPTSAQFSLYSSVMNSASATGPGLISQSYNSANKTLTLIVDPNHSSFTITIDAGEYSDTDHVPVIGSMSILDLEAGNWVFAGDKYYSFQATYYDLDGYADIENAKLAFTDGIHWINASYNQVANSWTLVNGTDYASLEVGAVSGSLNTLTVTFKIFLTNNILDANNIDVYSYCSDLLDEDSGWILVQSDYFNIYNLGGYNTLTALGDAGRYVGGDVFGLYARNLSSVEVVEYWRNMKSADLYFSYNVSFSGSVPQSITPDIWFGVDYCYQDEWIHGLYARISFNSAISNIQANVVNAAFTIYWYYKDEIVKVENVGAYCFQYGTYPNSLPTISTASISVPIHVELWFNQGNASSLIGGRVTSQYYAMTNSPSIWQRLFGFLIGTDAWGIDNDIPPMSTCFVSLKNDSDIIFSSIQLKLFKLVGIVEQTSTSSSFTVYANDFTSLAIDANSATMSGIPTPVYIEPRTPNMPQTGLFAWLGTLLGGIGASIVTTLISRLTIIIDAFIRLLDWIFTRAGWANGFSVLLGWISVFIGYMVSAISYTITLLISFFLFLQTWLPTTLTLFVSMVVGWVSIFGILLSIWTGMGSAVTGVGGFLVGLLQFLPLVVFIWIFMSKDFHEALDKIHLIWSLGTSLIDILIKIAHFGFDLITRIIQLMKPGG